MGISFTHIYGFNGITIAVKAHGHHEPVKDHYHTAGPSETAVIG
jgi:hypothetical protein